MKSSIVLKMSRFDRNYIYLYDTQYHIRFPGPNKPEEMSRKTNEACSDI